MAKHLVNAVMKCSLPFLHSFNNVFCNLGYVVEKGNSKQLNISRVVGGRVLVEITSTLVNLRLGSGYVRATMYCGEAGRWLP